jgi:predicted N-acetyltransferase YhbS
MSSEIRAEHTGDHTAVHAGVVVVVVGHADYYPRFGFERADGHGIACPFPVPPEAWMVHLLLAYGPEARGKVEYSRDFGCDRPLSRSVARVSLGASGGG